MTMRAKRKVKGGGRRHARTAVRRSAARRAVRGRAGTKRGRAKVRGPAARRAGAVKAGGRRPRPARGAGVVGSRKGGAGGEMGGVRVKRVSVKPKFSSPRMQKLEAMLERKRAEVLEQIARARAASVDVDRTSFAEVGDLVSASVEKEKAFEYSEAGVRALREIKGALQKLGEGTYGMCERCGKPIGVKRLEAMPSARLCVKCKITEESSGKTVPPPADNVFED